MPNNKHIEMDANNLWQEAKNYYLGENGYIEDKARAFSLIKKASEQLPDNGEIWGFLGECYMEGHGTEQDFAKAEAAYRKAVALGHNVIKLDFAYVLLKQNKKESITILSSLAEQEDELACYNLGLVYLKGDFETNDVNKGIMYLEKAIELGYGDAAEVLGKAYYDGTSVPHDNAKVAQYYDKAFEMGVSDSWRVYYFAGLAKFQGIYGVKEDLFKAREAWSKLPEFYENNNGIRDYVIAANTLLGMMCFEGEGGPIDKVLGEKCLRAAIDSEPLDEEDKKHRLEAMNSLGLYLYPNYNRLTEAIELFKKAAVMGNSNAQVNLGKAYYEGRGVPKSKEQAAYYFRMAAEQGNSQAIDNLLALQESNVSEQERRPVETNSSYESQAMYNEPPRRKNIASEAQSLDMLLERL